MKRVFLSILLIGLAAGPALADKLILRDGRVIEGKIVSEDREKVVIEQKYGRAAFARHEIREIVRERTPEEEFEEAFGRAKTAADFVALGKKAKEGGLAAPARRAFERALELDPENREAREALGHRLHEGRWWTEEEWAQRPEEVERRRKEAEEAARARAEKSEERYRKELAGVPWADAHIIETKHYVVKCNSTREVAQGYADFLEKIYEAYEKVFARHKKYWDKKSTVYIFRSNEEFRELTGAEMGVGGFYVPKSPNPNAFPDRIVAAFHGSFGTSGDTRLVLAHECTHQIQHTVCAGKEETFMARPAWWVEGLAVYFGDGFNFDRRGRLVIGIPRDRLAMLRRLIDEKVVPDQLKLSDLVKADFRFYQMNAGVTYPYGWSLVYYFLHRGEDRRGKQKPIKVKGKEIDLAKVFDEFFKVVTAIPPQGERTEPEYYAQKLDALLGVPIDELTADWREFVMGLELPKLGRVRGRVFESPETGFVAEKPEGWTWDEKGVEGDEAIRMANEQTGGLVRIEVDGNMFNWNAQGAADFVERQIDAWPLERKDTHVQGFPAVELIYKRVPEGGEKERYYRRVVVTTLRRVYQIALECDAERAAENEAAFEAVLAGFKILKDN